ncbi:hypothetical protein DA2_0852 [Desulfovibrio sp. A2]|nr:hypothetical protein DA2_0852 [Desulfovibrio sp. A2]
MQPTETTWNPAMPLDRASSARRPRMVAHRSAHSHALGMHAGPVHSACLHRHARTAPED